MSAFGPLEPADTDRFAQLLREHLPAAGRLAVRLCGNVDAAEDLLGEAMLRAVRGRDSFRGDAAFATWLYAIVVNAFRDSLRAKEARWPMLRLAGDELETPGASVAASQGLEAREIGERVARLGKRLVILQEGGYYLPALGDNARAWLRGVEGRPHDPQPSAGWTEGGVPG